MRPRHAAALALVTFRGYLYVPRRLNPALLAGLMATVVNVAGCAPNRAEWMSQAAQQQAKLATGPIGNEQEVKVESRQGALMVNSLAADLSKAAQGSQQQIAQAFAQDTAQISGGLDAIADSQTDEQFTDAVFAMCDPERKAAAPRVGRVMIGLANAINAKPPTNVPLEEIQRTVSYFDTFGERLIGIPAKCEHASAAMAEASAEEQQAEAEHQANLNAAATTTAIVLGAALITAGSVAAAEASRPIIVQSPPVENNYYISRQPVVAPWPPP